jgi:hypothetical protein
MFYLQMDPRTWRNEHQQSIRIYSFSERIIFVFLKILSLHLKNHMAFGNEPSVLHPRYRLFLLEGRALQCLGDRQLGCILN